MDPLGEGCAMRRSLRLLWRGQIESFALFCVASLVIAVFSFLLFSTMFGFVVGGLAGAWTWLMWCFGFLHGVDLATPENDGPRIM